MNLVSFELLMEQYVKAFLAARSFHEEHGVVLGMSLIPDKETIEVTFPFWTNIRFRLKMLKFGFKHGIYAAECNCLNS